MQEKLGRWLLVALCAASPAQGQIYAGRTEGGGVVLSNFRSAAADELTVEAPPALAPLAPLAPSQGVLAGPAVVSPQSPERFASLIRRIAREADVPAQLLHAVIAVESAFDPRAVSQKGALGLMQLMPQTAQRFRVADPFDPAQNIAGGAAYLRTLLDLFGGDLQLTLAAYNAGEAAVIRAGYRIPPYAETRAYVPRVLARLQRATLY